MTEPVYLRNSFQVGLIALLQVVAPAVLVVLALPFVAMLHGQDFNEFFRALAILAGILGLLVMQVKRNGRPLLMTEPVQIAASLVLRWLAVLVILGSAALLTQFHTEFPRRVIVSWGLLVPFLVVPAALVLHELRRRVTMTPANVRTAVFAGFTRHSRALAENLVAHPEMCTEVLGFFDDRGMDRLGPMGDFGLLGGLADLGDYARKYKVDVIFIALPIRHLERVANLVDDLQDSTASIYYVPDVFVFDLIQSRPGEVLGQPVISLCETPFFGFRGVLKRLTDIVLTLGALVPALPVMAVLAVIIRLTSRGPVIFKQRRYGLDGHEIVVYKFRSMYVAEDGDEIVQVSKVDPRVTPVGRILRSFSLDELPQLFNVLQGRMSLVGPRPHAVAHNEEYRQLIKGYMLRHKVLPGITGLAQVNGCRGETRTVADMEARVRYDLEYMRSWTPLLDLKILVLTVVRVFHDSKAY